METQFYQKSGEGEVQIDRYDIAYFRIEPISYTRKQMTLNVWVGGGDRREKYVYEVEGNRIYPQSYQLMSYFGWSFSVFPLALLATIGFILVCEKFYSLITERMAVRKLKLTPKN